MAMPRRLLRRSIDVYGSFIISSREDFIVGRFCRYRHEPASARRHYQTFADAAIFAEES